MTPDWCGAAICAAVVGSVFLGAPGLVAGPGLVLVVRGLTWWPDLKRGEGAHG